MSEIYAGLRAFRLLEVDCITIEDWLRSQLILKIEKDIVDRSKIMIKTYLNGAKIFLIVQI